MNIFLNFPSLIKTLTNLRFLNKYKKGIIEARKEGNNEKEREFILKATSTWGKKLSASFKTNLVVTGRENLPKQGPVVYVSNHQGYADIIALCAALDSIQFGFVTKENLDKVPFYGQWILRIRSVIMNRGEPREAIKAISQGIKNINQGFSMLIFPEGTRSLGPEMNDFKKGALKLATKPKVPVIPISLNGTWKVFEEKERVMPATVQIHIHPPVETARLSPEEERSLSNRLHKIIETKLLEMQENRPKKN